MTPGPGALAALVGVGLIVLVPIAGFMFGQARGEDYDEAEYFLDELDAVWSVWIAALLLPLIPAGIVGTWRSGCLGSLVLVLFIAILVAMSLLLGFASFTWVGLERSYPREDVPRGVLIVLTIATVGALMGYAGGRGIRWLVTGPPLAIRSEPEDGPPARRWHGQRRPAKPRHRTRSG